MASLSTLAWRISMRPNRPVHLSKKVLRCFYRNQSTDNETESATTNLDDYISESDEAARIEELRNVSGLTANQYRQYHGQPPDLPYVDLHKRKVLAAQYGSASGEDLRILWPPRDKLLDQEAEEKEDGAPLLERLAQIQSEKDAAQTAKAERHKMIAKNMSQMPKWISEYKKKQEVAEKEAQERAAKKEVLLEEARDYFGYKIKANDPKFLEMVEERKEREKKEAKKRKKEEKLKKQEVRLQEEIAAAKSGGSQAS